MEATVMTYHKVQERSHLKITRLRYIYIKRPQPQTKGTPKQPRII